jgi:hypothetical protein
MRSRDERLVENELLFRKVNERIVELGDAWADELEIVCECASENCTYPIAIQTGDYENVRRHSGRFIVLPGHELAQLEYVVDTAHGYLVVEKHPDLLEAVSGT